MKRCSACAIDYTDDATSCDWCDGALAFIAKWAELGLAATILFTAASRSAAGYRQHAERGAIHMA